VIDDLIALANRLASASPNKPRQADLRRAVSTAYYALFHAVAKNVADTMAGAVKGTRSEQAWAQAYRGLQHGDARAACEAIRNQNVSQDIKNCADAFVVLQSARHAADYDPLHRLTRAEAVLAVQSAKDAIGKLRSATSKDRRAFAVLVLVRKRSHG
jgi:uncharacterized protein (UPF0332 family)